MKNIKNYTLGIICFAIFIFIYSLILHIPNSLIYASCGGIIGGSLKILSIIKNNKFDD